MKLYVLPVEKACNASCAFCITNFRETAKKEILELGDLERVLQGQKVDKIEITGGGEPTLHPSINEIIKICSRKASTQLYTNGSLLEKLTGADFLDTLCVSVAHYSQKENKRIMGIDTNLEKLKSISVKKKLSLLLHRSGISTSGEVRNYLAWAKDYADGVVIRQLFEHDYKGGLNGEFVSSEKIFLGLGVDGYSKTPHGNKIFEHDGLQVEVESRSCACEIGNPVLHADGSLKQGWG